ncbi:uncharacterized protein LOC9663523 [Selaginella moellendorffii]|uniref:uncharacterized protein LOC9663523 n=1 Tax=Selaginella moellendorffii TaxID=88036 RepID=UPI000D1CAD4B|nr:uncharacterized protein LOC9663523 [Selaginella moellendorffii]|eukprot:XP_024523067.1 uncharacterized protein LOC9663523 [Selaginella moellendorffii]
MDPRSPTPRSISIWRGGWGFEAPLAAASPRTGLDRASVGAFREQLSFVEKVLLTRADLFNTLAPGSIKSSSSGRWILELSLLDSSFLATVGLLREQAYSGRSSSPPLSTSRRRSKSPSRGFAIA